MVIISVSDVWCVQKNITVDILAQLFVRKVGI